MIGICTDSSSQLPAELAVAYGIEVVPLTVTVDDVDYLEGVDLDADGFYAMYAGGHAPTVDTSQPSPGQFAAAYEDLIARGCTSILSVHISAAFSGTLNAARLAAHSMPVPVRLVDSGTASFGVSCCVWAAAEALANGATLDEAAQVAERLAPTIGNVFVVGALDHLAAGGRAAGLEDGDLPVLALRDGNVEVISRHTNAVDAVSAMAVCAIEWGQQLWVAVGHSDAATEPLADALHAAVSESANVLRVVRYRVGPSVGAHTGPGTAGCFMFPGR
ncbi:MAG: DegV family protein [Actinomycetota bacterium]|nr:DegV family protein [Actinomycetota bacterium]